jgi:hypothetical protein
LAAVQRPCGPLLIVKYPPPPPPPNCGHDGLDFLSFVVIYGKSVIIFSVPYTNIQTYPYIRSAKSLWLIQYRTSERLIPIPNDTSTAVRRTKFYFGQESEIKDLKNLFQYIYETLFKALYKSFQNHRTLLIKA